jgi:hypothetical protein
MTLAAAQGGFEALTGRGRTGVYNSFQNPAAYPSMTQAVPRASSQELLEAEGCRSERSCGLAPDSTGGLLIRRSLVRAQVGEPGIQRGVASRGAAPSSFLGRHRARRVGIGQVRGPNGPEAMRGCVNLAPL